MPETNMKNLPYSKEKNYLEMSIQYEVSLINNENREYKYWEKIYSELEQDNEFWYKWHCVNQIREFRKSDVKEDYKEFLKLNREKNESD